MNITDDTISLLREFRRELHRNPEISGHETNTQERIMHFLRQNTVASLQKVARTGVLATFDSRKEGPVIMLRADIDALPIQETNDFEYRSVTEGISHKCGHDGHTAIMAGVAIALNSAPIRTGKVLLLFQPAEENGAGAAQVLADETFDRLEIDHVFALHNLPGFTAHQVIVKENEFTSNVNSIIIKLHGKTSHAGEPGNGLNPGTAVGELLLYADEQTYDHPESDDFFLMTTVFVTLGEKAYGISAGYAEVHLTLRSWSVELFEKKCRDLESKISEICKRHTLRCETSWIEEFHANINHPESVIFIRKGAENSGLDIMEIKTPFKWGEDFGLFTQRYKGAMFGLGAGTETPALHNPDYDFPDELINTGIIMFMNIINEISRD